MNLEEFNNLPQRQAAAILRPCLDVERWINDIVASRPYASNDELLAAGSRSAESLSEAETAAALAHHPRIGERADGNSAEATLSRGEQAALQLNEDITAQLSTANRAYEDRFNRVFLIRAAGRSSAEILSECERRLGNDDDIEAREVAEQLSAIALLRLEQVVSN
ncbi:2-oxo-4-hydroxy-4-carboxy-5-ureidoimidazoline decarboxylase [Arthrobacter sp. MYb213]|uniref:2-oxo-4-hydroxy-4-carboxy-5-ureidoimidazoline decarboxylase n=1 Tax=Arthrobacter sp. MYb213 TaxID=1848595 RepID=UPI000CFBA80B|nr:2-oxo-4-hydroxy-4-carboxy-5-ureidoimidazoline decarboxylase [Arthrobacter sp. MYb213]PRB70182.1 OHCU decarboxylase [Arthrobacter sp. MYb213]